MIRGDKVVLKGTLRINSRSIKVVEWDGLNWINSNKSLPNAFVVINLFKAHNNFDKLVDSKNNKFLKGQISPEGKVQGARINILPDGEVLDKPYSLFSPHLTVHDESSSHHWDVIYQNPNGQFAYVYTQAKKKRSKNKKYKKVSDFDKLYNKLNLNVTKALGNPEDFFALPMFTLLKTFMRVGNELYFRAHKHKGLTTLKKSDISIKNNNVNFHYLAKSGVPMVIDQLFPDNYVKRLKYNLSRIKNNDFVFTKPNGSMLRDSDFMKAFKFYCGEEFYPHIVRSHFATKKVQEFLSSHKKASKSEVKDLFNGIAERLGHKRFSKKDNKWVDSSAVTIHYYVEPKLVDKVNKMIGK